MGLVETVTSQKRRSVTGYSAEECRVALLWLNGKVSDSQIASGKNLGYSGARHWVGGVVRWMYQNGKFDK